MILGYRISGCLYRFAVVLPLFHAVTNNFIFAITAILTPAPVNMPSIQFPLVSGNWGTLLYWWLGWGMKDLIPTAAPVKNK